MYMSCGCNSSLQSGGRRKKRSRQSHRKYRGGGSFFDFFKGSTNSNVVDNVKTTTSELYNNIRTNTSELYDNLKNVPTKLEEQRSSLMNNPNVQEGKQFVYKVRDEISAAGRGAFQGIQDGEIAVKEVATGTADELKGLSSSIFQGLKDAFKSNENKNPIPQAGGRKHKRSKSHRKTRKGGKKSKRRTRKH